MLPIWLLEATPFVSILGTNHFILIYFIELVIKNNFLGKKKERIKVEDIKSLIQALNKIK